jgi:SAM-dependent methyltransferase
MIQAIYPACTDFCHDYAASAEGQQLREVLRQVPPGARVLDVGAGYGIIAIYLASQGYRVCAVEPSPDLCAYIQRAATLYGLALDIFNVSAECLDLLPKRNFDLCMFNASLHHCDDPLQALAHCHDLLAPTGKLALLNEPLLHFFRSKAWFERQLESGSLVTGDYGGNEHIYYYHEYRAMLARAGFGDVADFVAFRYRDPSSYFRALNYQKAKKMSVLVRKVYYNSIAGLLRLGMCGKPALYLLKRLSLLQTNFVAARDRRAA